MSVGVTVEKSLCGGSTLSVRVNNVTSDSPPKSHRGESIAGAVRELKAAKNPHPAPPPVAFGVFP